MPKDPGYLARLAQRRALAQLKRQAAFGIAFSSVLIAIGLWRYFLVIGSNSVIWAGVVGVGLAGLLVACVAPSLWHQPERFVALVVQKLGRVLFAALLVFLYLSLVTPLRLFAQHGSRERFLSWKPGAERPLPSWSAKLSSADTGQRRHKRSVLAAMVGVLQHFHRRRLYWMLPFLAIALALGVALFFVKGSALAPFIYTLF